MIFRCMLLKIFLEFSLNASKPFCIIPFKDLERILGRFGLTSRTVFYPILKRQLFVFTIGQSTLSVDRKTF